MPMADIFESDMFSTLSLTAAINNQEFVPRRLGELGLFEAEGITTTNVTVEESNGQLALVESKPRGGTGQVVKADKREGIPFNTFHLPETATILADEVQNVRAFGSDDQLQGVQEVVNSRLVKMRRQLEATHEWQRIGGIRGFVLDADGSTTLIDVYERFGLVQPTVSITFGTDPVHEKSLDILEKIEDGLGSEPFITVRAFCGKQFWRDLLSDSTVREAYLNTQAAARLRGDPRESFEYGGIIWERYRGNVAGNAYVPDAKAYAVPEGVPDMFITRFAPADYADAVNTIGLPSYASAERLKHGKGVEVEAQSNPLHIPTRPLGIVEVTSA